MDSTIAIGSDGTIYVTSEGGILNALNSDGTLKWSYTTGGIIFSSPAIGSDGTIYVDTMEGLNALNPDGTLKWLLSTGYVISSPAIGSDGTIYVGSDESIFYAINPDGTLKWSYAAGGAIALSSSAINTDGAICVGSYDGHFYSLNPNGTLKWSYLTGLSISSSPAIGADGIIYVGSDDGHLYAFNPDGTIKWSYIIGSTAGNYSSPAIGVDGTIYVGSWANGNLYAINSSSMGLATSSWPMFHHDLKHTGLATPTPPTLTVTNSGTGSGTVTSTPSGINCGTTCSAIYSSGPSVTLTATPASGSTFTGWSGACENASGTCVIAMFAAETVTAHYIIKDIPTFRDVSNTSVYETYIEAIYNNGITTGCGNGDYCPSAQVTRDEMAAFLVRATQVAAGQSTVNFTCNGGVAGASVRCAGTIPYFLDVPATDAFFPYVQKLYELGITTGCGNGNYCPSDDVTRDEMAAFLARAFLGMH
jgi:hypothetical protein